MLIWLSENNIGDERIWGYLASVFAYNSGQLSLIANAAALNSFLDKGVFGETDVDNNHLIFAVQVNILYNKKIEIPHCFNAGTWYVDNERQTLVHEQFYPYEKVEYSYS